MQNIYLAGWDVFRLNAKEHLNELALLCKNYHFKALSPLDKEVDLNKEKSLIRQEIYQANTKLIQQADILIANLNSFRHGEPDADTIFEIGYAKALGKKIYGYCEDDSSMLEKTRKYDNAITQKDGLWLDGNKLTIEDFDASFNLMISESCDGIYNEFEEVLKVLSNL